MFPYGPGKGAAPEPAQLIINAWTTECGDCGFGRGSWADSPALADPPMDPLTPDSRTCPGCGVHFTHSFNVYTGGRVEFVEEAA